MKAGWVRRPRAVGLALLAAGTLALTLGLAAATGQQTTFNEREVKSAPPAVDDPKLDVWTLDFRFKDPRLIKVHIPGRGTRICWYLWYQVINRTKEPRKFVPDFELVTHDYPAVYHDEVLTTAEEAIKKLEDPTGYQEIKNSVTIAAQAIPVSKPPGEAFPKAVTSVAIWDGTPADPKARDPKVKDLSDSTKFSIFINGLSNGSVQVDPVGQGKDAVPQIRRKTLQLNFERKGDRFVLDSRDIRFVSPAEWTYRAWRIRIPGDPAGADKAKGNGNMGPAPPGLQFQFPKR